MKKFYLPCLLILSLSIINCATKYKSKYWKGGYADTKIQEDTYQVSFSGNAYISAEKVWVYLLYRCAEITVNNGCDYFIILQGKDDSGQMLVGSVSSSGYISGGTMNKAKMIALIKCGKGPKPQNNVNAYDAKDLMRNLGPQIKRIPIIPIH